MRSGETSIEQRPDMRICVVQRILDGMKKCTADGSQRKREDVENKCRTSGGQTILTYNTSIGNTSKQPQMILY